ETVRTWPGAVRSTHPHTSFTAVGSDAAALMAGHRLDCQLGEESPLAALERLDGKVLLLGVGYDRCTAFHLAEYRIPHPALVEVRGGVRPPSGRCWITFLGVAPSSDDFAAL